MPVPDHIQLVDRIRGLDYVEMIRIGEQAARDAKPGERHLISDILFWLRHGIRPFGMSSEEFLLLRPLAEDLVARKQLKPGILDAFRDAERD